MTDRVAVAGKPWITWPDALLMPEDGKRHEAIDGELWGTPCPPTRHGLVSARLAAALFSMLEPYGMTLPGLGVEFADTQEGVIPDFLFVSKERLHIVHEDWVRGAPDLVVEITQPGLEWRDRTLKRDLYRRQGVPEYWVADPDTKVLEVWYFGEGATEPERYTTGVPVRVGGRVVGEIELTKIFQPL